MATSPNYYDLLQISRHATIEIIRAAHQQLVARILADRTPGDTQVFARIALLDEALTVLTDPKRRSQYDECLTASSASSTEAASGMPIRDQASNSVPSSDGAARGNEAVSWWSVLPDARYVFAAGVVLFLIGHGRMLAGEPSASVLAFAITCFLWLGLFGYPAYLCHLKNLRGAKLLIAVLFLLVAAFDVAVPLYIQYETEPLLREPRPAPMVKAPDNSRLPNFLDALENPKDYVARRQSRFDPLGLKLSIAIARHRELVKGESLLANLVRRGLPVMSSIGRTKEAGVYKQALQRLNARTASEADIEVIARFECLYEIEVPLTPRDSTEPASERQK